MRAVNFIKCRLVTGGDFVYQICFIIAVQFVFFRRLEITRLTLIVFKRKKVSALNYFFTEFLNLLRNLKLKGFRRSEKRKTFYYKIKDYPVNTFVFPA
jgi:hypothetical protein